MEILIPSTFGGDERDERLQVAKIGRILRGAAIFGVEKITIYKDGDDKINEKNNSKFLEKNLKYGACPPFLRKDLFPYDKDLEYAGILPPLRIPSHGYPQNKEQENYREAVVVEKRGDKALLEAGIDKKLETKGLKKGERVTIKILENNRCEVVDEGIPGFWNIKIENKRENLGEVLKERKGKTVIGTSRKGKSIKSLEKEIKNLDFGDVVMAFGSAWRGIYDLSKRDNFSMELFDHIINTIPYQQTKTVRTEEAQEVTLGIFNLWK